MVSAVSVPVTADIEGGFGADADAVGETVAGVLAAGAVGINIEDGPHRAPAEMAERLAAARAAADAAGVPLYINARVDTYLRGLGDPAARLDETLARAAAYLRAGATGIFVPGVLDPATVAELAKGVDAPSTSSSAPTPRPSPPSAHSACPASASARGSPKPRTPWSAAPPRS